MPEDGLYQFLIGEATKVDKQRKERERIRLLREALRQKTAEEQRKNREKQEALEEEKNRIAYKKSLDEAQHELDEFTHTLKKAKPYLDSFTLDFFTEKAKAILSSCKDSPREASIESKVLNRNLKEKYLAAKEVFDEAERLKNQRTVEINNVFEAFIISEKIKDARKKFVTQEEFEKRIHDVIKGYQILWEKESTHLSEIQKDALDMFRIYLMFYGVKEPKDLEPIFINEGMKARTAYFHELLKNTPYEKMASVF